MEKRFQASIRVHVKDNLFGNSILVNASKKKSNSVSDLLGDAQELFAKYLGMMNTKIDEKSLHSHAKFLKNSEGWGDKKIKSHFEKYGIDIEPYINSQKKLL